jgi:hypothetical protein
MFYLWVGSLWRLSARRSPYPRSVTFSFPSFFFVPPPWVWALERSVILSSAKMQAGIQHLQAQKEIRRASTFFRVTHFTILLSLQRVGVEQALPQPSVM